MAKKAKIRKIKTDKTKETIALELMSQVFGASGTEMYSGYISEDYLPLWNSIKSRVDVVDEMRKSDATVAAGLRVLKAPILAGQYYIDTDDEDMRQICERSLFGIDGRSWKEFLREALLFLDFGFYPFEKIWEVKDNFIVLRDLAPRIPRSIEKFATNSGEPGITQNVYGDLAEGKTQPSIPKKKLVIFTNDKEGDDVSGQSVLRPAHKHFFIKDLLYRIAGISCERYGVGIPKITIPDGAGDPEKAKAEELGRSIKSNEKAYIVQYAGMTIEILTPQGNPQEGQITNLIQHHNREILLALLAHSLDLGSGASGSFALSTNQKSDLMEFAEEKALYIEEQINTHVLRELIDANFGPQENYPKLKHHPLGEVNFPEVATALKTLVDAGLIKVTPSLETSVRQQFRLPTLTDKEVEEAEEAKFNSMMDDMEQEIAGSAAFDDLDLEFDDSMPVEDAEVEEEI